MFSNEVILLPCPQTKWPYLIAYLLFHPQNAETQWMGLPLQQATPSDGNPHGIGIGQGIAGLLLLKSALLAVVAVRRQAWSWVKLVRVCVCVSVCVRVCVCCVLFERR
jgi:hypothetical protein